MMRIRLATPDDGAALSDIYRPAVADRGDVLRGRSADAAEMARRVAATLEHYPWLVCEDAGPAIGYAYASRHRERASTSGPWRSRRTCATARTARASGAGSTSRCSACWPCRATSAPSRASRCRTDASVGFHAALGFTPVGVYHRIGWKCGRWHDVTWLERAVAEQSRASRFAADAA